MNLKSTTDSLRTASQKLALQNASVKNMALLAVADALDKNRASIISANKQDIDAARAASTSALLAAIIEARFLSSAAATASSAAFFWLAF